MKTLYLIVPFAPLVASVIVGLFGPKIGRSASHWLCILGVAVSLVASIPIFQDVMAGHSFNGDVYTWLRSGDFKLTIGFLIDPLTVTMMLCVVVILASAMWRCAQVLRGRIAGRQRECLAGPGGQTIE